MDIHYISVQIHINYGIYLCHYPTDNFGTVVSEDPSCYVSYSLVTGIRSVQIHINYGIYLCHYPTDNFGTVVSEDPSCYVSYSLVTGIRSGIFLFHFEPWIFITFPCK